MRWCRAVLPGGWSGSGQGPAPAGARAAGCPRRTPVGAGPARRYGVPGVAAGMPWVAGCPRWTPVGDRPAGRCGGRTEPRIGSDLGRPDPVRAAAPSAGAATQRDVLADPLRRNDSVLHSGRFPVCHRGLARGHSRDSGVAAVACQQHGQAAVRPRRRDRPTPAPHGFISARRNSDGLVPVSSGFVFVHRNNDGLVPASSGLDSAHRHGLRPSLQRRQSARTTGLAQRRDHEPATFRFDPGFVRAHQHRTAMPVLS